MSTAGWVEKPSLGRATLFEKIPFKKIGVWGRIKMKIKRKFTVAGEDAYAGINFINTTSEIRNPDGTIVFKLDDVEVPDTWSQVASDVIAQKYFLSLIHI